MVEQRTENPRVGGSIPPLGTILPSADIHKTLSFCAFVWLWRGNSLVTKRDQLCHSKHFLLIARVWRGNSFWTNSDYLLDTKTFPFDPFISVARGYLSRLQICSVKSRSGSHGRQAIEGARLCHNEKSLAPDMLLDVVELVLHRIPHLLDRQVETWIGKQLAVAVARLGLGGVRQPRKLLEAGLMRCKPSVDALCREATDSG